MANIHMPIAKVANKPKQRVKHLSLKALRWMTSQKEQSKTLNLLMRPERVIAQGYTLVMGQLNQLAIQQLNKLQGYYMDVEMSICTQNNATTKLCKPICECVIKGVTQSVIDAIHHVNTEYATHIRPYFTTRRHQHIWLTECHKSDPINARESRMSECRVNVKIQPSLNAPWHPGWRNVFVLYDQK